MKTLRNQLLTLACLSLMGAGSAQAITVDGVSFNIGSQFVGTSVWENVLTAPTDTLYGVGLVNHIDCNLCGGTTWINGQNNTQLTYSFNNYTVGAWEDSSLVWHDSTYSTGFGNAIAIAFTGGTVNIYAQSTTSGSYTQLNPSGTGNQATDMAAATDGSLFLSYVGTPVVFNINGTFESGTLAGTPYSASSVHQGNTGQGYMDVVGGDAMSYFDTNSWHVCTAVDVTGACTSYVDADAQLSSQVTNTVSGAWPLSGTASIKTNTVPEPATLALLGIGMLGMGVFAGKKRGA